MKKCILILSNKSSGSSAVQRLLAQAADLKYVEKTRHFENETLYWTKAASLLRLPQRDMLDSEVPIAPDEAKQDLLKLLADNVPDYLPPMGDRALIFEGWQQLCDRYSPIFLEKSPHHLLQISALDLIVEAIEQLQGEVDFLLVGLVRNPMDVMYSAFRRWRTSPEALQYEWLAAYDNLQNLKTRLGDRVVIIRYEDLVDSLDPLAPVFDFCETTVGENAETLRGGSLLKWKSDRTFGFTLAPEVYELANAYGYTSEQLNNKPWQFWPLYQGAVRIAHQNLQWAKQIYLKLT